jgi:ATP-binding cassette subfamily F protein uup
VYEEFRAQEEAEAASDAPARPSRTAAPTRHKADTSDKPRRLSYKEQRELRSLEQQIDKMETRKADLAEQINLAGNDYQRYQQLAEELHQLEADLDAAVERWAELAELA